MRSPFEAHMEALLANRSPLPLTRSEAIDQAVRLRMLNLSYESVAVVMRAYHGVAWTGNTWRKHCRAQGVVACPKGYGFRRG